MLEGAELAGTWQACCGLVQWCGLGHPPTLARKGPPGAVRRTCRESSLPYPRAQLRETRLKVTVMLVLVGMTSLLEVVRILSSSVLMKEPKFATEPPALAAKPETFIAMHFLLMHHVRGAVIVLAAQMVDGKPDRAGRGGSSSAGLDGGGGGGGREVTLA